MNWSTINDEKFDHLKIKSNSSNNTNKEENDDNDTNNDDIKYKGRSLKDIQKHLNEMTEKTLTCQYREIQQICLRSSSNRNNNHLDKHNNNNIRKSRLQYLCLLDYCNKQFDVNTLASAINYINIHKPPPTTASSSSSSSSSTAVDTSSSSSNLISLEENFLYDKNIPFGVGSDEWSFIILLRYKKSWNCMYKFLNDNDENNDENNENDENKSINNNNNIEKDNNNNNNNNSQQIPLLLPNQRPRDGCIESGIICGGCYKIGREIEKEKKEECSTGTTTCTVASSPTTTKVESDDNKNKINNDNEQKYVLKLKRCSKCKTIKYCSINCQKIDWERGHKLICRKDGIKLKKNKGHDERHTRNEWVDKMKKIWMYVHEHKFPIYENMYPPSNNICGFVSYTKNIHIRLKEVYDHVGTNTYNIYCKEFGKYLLNIQGASALNMAYTMFCDVFDDNDSGNNDDDDDNDNNKSSTSSSSSIKTYATKNLLTSWEDSFGDWTNSKK